MSTAYAVLDHVDKRIIVALCEDARASFAEIAKRLRIPEATVRFRVKRLKSRGVITRFVPLLNLAKIGLEISGAILLKIDPVSIEKLSKSLISLKETAFVYQSTGEYDIIAVVYAQDMAHLEEIVKKIKLIPGVKESRVAVTTRLMKYEPIPALEL